MLTKKEHRQLYKRGQERTKETTSWSGFPVFNSRCRISYMIRNDKWPPTVSLSLSLSLPLSLPWSSLLSVMSLLEIQKLLIVMWPTHMSSPRESLETTITMVRNTSTCPLHYTLAPQIAAVCTHCPTSKGLPHSLASLLWLSFCYCQPLSYKLKPANCK